MGVDFSGSTARIYTIEASIDMVDWQTIGVAGHQGDGQVCIRRSRCGPVPVPVLSRRDALRERDGEHGGGHVTGCCPKRMQLICGALRPLNAVLP